VTNFSDAVAMVRAHPFTRALGRDELSDQGQSYITFGGEVMTISVNTGSDDRVSSIDIVFIIATLYAKPEPLLGSNTLGEFAALSGVPNSIETRNGYTLARYSNDNMSVVSLNSLVNGEWVISAENQLSSITLEASDVFEQRLKLSRSRLSPWRGFSDVRRYALTANP